MKLFIVLMLLSFGVGANELVINVVSKHHKQNPAHLNEKNYGIGIQSRKYEVGYFINSYYSKSVYAGFRSGNNFASFNYGLINHPESNVYASFTFKFKNTQIGFNNKVFFAQIVF